MIKQYISISLVCLLLGFSGAAAADADALFKYKGKVFKSDDLEPKHKLKLFEADEQAYRIKGEVIEDAVLNLYFEDLAKKSGKSVEEVKKEKTAVATPSDNDLKKFYEENRKKIPYPFEQVKNDLVRFVQERNKHEKRHQIMSEINKAGFYQNLLAAPIAPKVEIETAGFYSKGSPSAKVKVVEFADYKCPHCKEASIVLKEVLKKYGDKIHFVFIDFPIIGDSHKIAEGAVCAKKQNKYWEYHESAFEHQGKAKTPEEVARLTKLDEKAFRDCLSKGEGKELVEKGKALGEKVGVTGTPSVYINGIKYNKGYSVQDLSEAIDRALSGKSAS